MLNIYINSKKTEDYYSNYLKNLIKIWVVKFCNIIMLAPLFNYYSQCSLYPIIFLLNIIK